MNQNNATHHETVISTHPPSLCSHITTKGRRCRLPVTNPGSPYCRSHSRIRRSSHREANPLSDFPPELSQFNSYADVTKFLARVLTLLSEGKISPRRAAVMSYIANSLLNSLRAAERLAQYEAAHTEETVRIDWTGIPRPERELRAIAEESKTEQETRTAAGSQISQPDAPPSSSEAQQSPPQTTPPPAQARPPALAPSGVLYSSHEPTPGPRKLRPRHLARWGG